MPVTNLRHILDAAPLAMCILDVDSKLIYCNSSFSRLLGYSQAELLESPIQQLLDTDDQQAHQDRLISITQQHAATNDAVDFRFIQKSRHTIWLSESCSSIQEDEKTLIICQFLDIDQRKKNEQRLSLIEQRFNLSQRHAKYGVWDWNIRTNDLYWSNQIGPLLGIGDGEIDANYADFVNATHPDDREYVAEVIRAAIENGAEYNIEHRVVWADGTIRWILETGDVIFDENGVPLNMIGVARDVTEHHHANVALKESAKLLNSAQAIAHVGHWSWDVISGKLFWSDEIYRIFGYSPGEFEPTYKKFIETLHPDDIERIKISEEQAFSQGKPHSIDHRIIRKDGSIAWVHEEAIAITDERNQPIRLTGTVQDITERKKLEQQLADKITQAEAANYAKTTFLSHMSHELRTPLNGILGFAQIMETEKLSAGLAGYVKEIMNSGWHLLDLVDDLLDLSRVETGAIDLKPEPVNLKDLIRECQSMISPMLKERQLMFSANFEDSAAVILADRRRLKQILINLLSNAIKYNRPNGEVQVFCQLSGEHLRINIRDTGQGIPEHLMPRLFTPFDRLGKEGIEESGTGIGLALVKRLADAMGCELGVESIEGVGSTFWLEFNLANELPNALLDQDSDVHKADNKQLNNTIRVLYVEDNPANLRLIQGFLSNRPNFELMAATTAVAGLDLARTQIPDVILMDIKLPDMSGFEALARLRTVRETAHIPVIAVSAVAHEQDVAAGLRAGFFRYITKPVNLGLLEKTIYYAVRGEG
ncbi:MAG: PAS domain-containing protein [Gammaproteobacteria bacterium]|nr:PAS domain-containing protein [Gammaproteobacteria bacterium]